MSVFETRTITTKDGADVTLRAPELDDAQAMIDYLDAVRRTTDGLGFSPHDKLPTLAFERDFITQRRESPGGVHIMGVADNQIIAMAGYQTPQLHKLRHVASLGISLHAAWRGRGLGRQIMRALIEHSRANPQVEILSLQVHHDNPGARKLYQEVGFVEEAVLPRRAKMDGRYVDVVCMSMPVVSDAPC